MQYRVPGSLKVFIVTSKLLSDELGADILRTTVGGVVSKVSIV
jgi:hypothetical protein